MEFLNRELSVLSQAVAFPNLSSASMHVGLSQPQLSRIVARIEAELGVVLLDREVRRKSGWTAVAQRLAESCSRASRGLGADIHRITQETEPRELSIGSLEGMVPLASTLARGLFQRTSVRTVDLSVLDLDPLEEQFLSGTLDLLFTSREPGRRKYRNSLRVGYQSVEKIGDAAQVEVLSPFEFRARGAGARPQEGARLLISNSLALRRNWIEHSQGRGILPSKVYSTRSSSADKPLFLMAQDHLSPRLWKTISELKLNSA